LLIFQSAIALAFTHGVSKRNMIPVAAIFLKLICSISNVSNFQNFNADYENIFSELLKIGSVLHLGCGLINHSCDPNTYQISYGTTSVFRAKRPVKKGEQLTHSYWSALMEFPRLERQKKILGSFKFECK